MVEGHTLSTTALLLTLVPIGLQGIVMFVDEFHYHLRRGLPRWERLGHPIDTLSVLACQGWAWAHASGRVEDSRFWPAFIALAAFSSLLITKDEWVHARECEPGEQWLHSILFVLHPVTLGCTAWLAIHQRTDWIGVILMMTSGLLIHQVVYWNGIWTRTPRTRKSTRS